MLELWGWWWRGVEGEEKELVISCEHGGGLQTDPCGGDAAAEAWALAHVPHSRKRHLTVSWYRPRKDTFRFPLE